MSRLHPTLPTQEEAQANPALVYSNHVPFLVEIPDSEDGPVKILSWNVNENNGLKAFGIDSEVEEERNARLERIAEAIIRFIQTHQPDFISLQGLVEDRDRISPLLLTIDRELEAASLRYESRSSSNNGCLTLFNVAKFSHTPGSNNMPRPVFDGISPLRGHYSEYWRGINQKNPILLANIDLGSSQTSMDHENSVKYFFDHGTDTDLKIIIGNFNCDVAAGACYTSRTIRGFKEAEIKQATIVYLNPQTGETLNNPLENGSSTSSTVDQACKNLETDYAWNNAIDAIQNNPKLDSNIKSVFLKLQNSHGLGEQFYNRLKIGFIKIAMALNEPSAQLRFDIIKDFIIEIDNSVADIAVPNETRSVITNAANVLTQILSNVYDDNAPLDSTEKTPKQELLELLQKPHLLGLKLTTILDVENNTAVSSEVKEKFRAFYDAVSQLESAPNQSDKVIIKQIVDLAENVRSTPTLTLETIRQSATELDEKLYGKPPASISLKVAACGVIGALVGAALGVAIGAAVTGWGGGFGAIPGIIAGAFTGWTVATTAMVAGAGTCAAIASGIGFWRGKRAASNYQAHKIEENQKVTSEILAAEKTFFTPGTA